MLYKRTEQNYTIGIGKSEESKFDEISEAEYNSILDIIRTKPVAPEGYDYRLKADLTWELYELPQIEETETAYTAEQLEQMTSTELREICSEMGISGTMTKANMISLILGKQSNSL